MRTSGRFPSALGGSGLAAAIRASRSRFPSSHRARALIFATATGSSGTLTSGSASGDVRRGSGFTGWRTSRSTAGYGSGGSDPLAGILIFTARFASSAVIAIATRSSVAIESRAAEIPPRSSVCAAAPGASSGSIVVAVRPSTVRRAAIDTPFVRATKTSLRESAMRPATDLSPSFLRASAIARRARSAGLADASLSKALRVSFATFISVAASNPWHEIRRARVPSSRSSEGPFGMRASRSHPGPNAGSAAVMTAG